jgi:hypothetical protein
MSSQGPPIDWISIGLGIGFGVLVRLILLRKDYRHYPGYPAGTVGQVTVAFFAAVIGGAFFPALVAKEYQAATFLVLAATQFTGLRKVEVAKLESIEKLTLVQRGTSYIQGIAQEFEERNYLVMGVAVVTALASSIAKTEFGDFWPWVVGGGIGIIAIIVAYFVKSGPELGDVCTAELVPLTFKEGSLLYAGPVMLMEVGLPKARERYVKDGVGIVLTPTTPRGAGAIWDLGQRQAIVYNLYEIIGTKTDIGYGERIPICRMDLPEGTGKAGICLLPVANDPDRILEAVRRTPLLETAKAHSVYSPALIEWQHNHEGGK